ncbi:MAG: S-layer homology domain-containing protein, partial [Chloroflexia bacterium]
VFTSEPTHAPIDFSDVAPHWYSDTPNFTTISIELRTSKDGQTWADWQLADPDDIIMETDPYTETFGFPIPVDQVDRSHRFVQSRITLHSAQPGTSPTFYSLSYTFINAGVTPNPPHSMVMIQGTPSDVPKPPTVSRKDWGSPQGESSPKWTPVYKRVTHMVIHHTATSNSDTDFAARVRSIWYYHSKTRGWGDIGYNYLIDPNGVIYEGRAGGDDVEAGHAYPFNVGTMGVGMIGNFMSVLPSQAAQRSLVELLSWKSAQRGIDPHAVLPITGFTDCGGKVIYNRATISGHRDYAGTACKKKFNTSTCPGDTLEALLPALRDQVVLKQPPFRANFGIHDTPGNMEPGATADVRLSIRNSGALTWETGGQPSTILGYRWLTPDNQPVTGWQDIKSALPSKVGFADTLTMTAKLNAPTVPGHYALIWDLYIEGQGWFSDQGSQPLRVDIVVGRNLDDKTPPTSQVLPLPVWSSDTALPIRWTGDDNPKGAGIASYDIQVRIAPSGDWTDWKTGTNEINATYIGEDGVTYEFRSRARDAAGNIEDWPQQPDTYTTIDTRPPSLIIDDPESGDHVMPGILIVHGRTEPGTFIAVNDTRAEESGGVFTSTLQAEGRDFAIHVSASDPAGNVSRLEVLVQAAPRYADVPVGHPAFRAVEYLSDRNLLGGFTDGLFRPNAAVTRAQYAKMLVSSMGWSLIKPYEQRFTDIPPDHPLYAYIETVAARGLLPGYLDGTFEPNLPVSRNLALSALLSAGSRTLLTGGNLIAGLPPGHWANSCDPSAKRTLNQSDNTSCGINTATRADVSMLIYNLYRQQENLEIATPLDDQGR